MPTKIIGFARIEWVGIKSWLIHGLILAGATFVTYALASASHHNFGQYQAIAVFVIGWAGDFAKKFFENYNIPLQVDTQA